MNILDHEKPDGVIVTFGGQTPLKLAKQLEAAGVPILGTTPDNIDVAEDRKRFGIITRMSVRDNITMPSWSKFTSARFWMKDGSLLQVAKEYVETLKVKTPHVHQETRLLSGGNQQKVVIAKWLLRDCDILFFDEPTRGIDVGAKAEIYKLLEALAEQGKAIVVISSELPEILRVSHRILVMSEGRLTGELDGKAATQESIMTLATQRQKQAA